MYTYVNDSYVQYSALLWSENDNKYVVEEYLKLHKCNQTDRTFFSQNSEFIDANELSRDWENLLCLDNPERIKMRDGKAFESN